MEFFMVEKDNTPINGFLTGIKLKLINRVNAVSYQLKICL